MPGVSKPMANHCLPVIVYTAILESQPNNLLNPNTIGQKKYFHFAPTK